MAPARETESTAPTNAWGALCRQHFACLFRSTMAADPMPESNQPPGPSMTLGIMRELGVHRLLVSCLNPACRHEVAFDVSNYPGDMDVPSLARRMICSKCGGEKAFVRPNWKERQPTKA